MFFPERIRINSKNDNVLEVGPGSTPHPRSNVLLEKKFDKIEAFKQRGETEELVTDKKVVFYDGEKFPFKDNEFDYVICSHVLEHIPLEGLHNFISELTRVARKGYLEFPTVYYEYLYDFDVHKTILNYSDSDNVIYYCDKKVIFNKAFKPVNNFFLSTLVQGHNHIVDYHKNIMYQGFEWREKITLVESVENVFFEASSEVTPFKVDILGIVIKERVKARIKKILGKMYKKNN